MLRAASWRDARAWSMPGADRLSTQIDGQSWPSLRPARFRTRRLSIASANVGARHEPSAPAAGSLTAAIGQPVRASRNRAVQRRRAAAVFAARVAVSSDPTWRLGVTPASRPRCPVRSRRRARPRGGQDARGDTARLTVRQVFFPRRLAAGNRDPASAWTDTPDEFMRPSPVRAKDSRNTASATSAGVARRVLRNTLTRAQIGNRKPALAQQAQQGRERLGLIELRENQSVGTAPRHTRRRFAGRRTGSCPPQ